MICFTTGRGSVYGCKPAPSIKLATNTRMYERMKPRTWTSTAARACAATCGHAARACCSEDEDMAHKIAREMERAQQALVANLSSLR
jgi:hypothetical protein